MSQSIGTLVSGLFLIAVYSYLFTESRLYRYTEHIYVGFAAAHAMVTGWKNIKQQAITPLADGDWIMLVPLALGCLLYAKFSKRFSYLSRTSLAFMMGVSAGVTITGSAEASFVKQVRATVLPLNNLDNVVLVLGTASTLAFFLFIPLGLGRRAVAPNGSANRGGHQSGNGNGIGVGKGADYALIDGSRRNGGGRLAVISWINNLGRATMMVAFGSSFGFVVMARLSHLVARLQFLFTKVFHVIR